MTSPRILAICAVASSFLEAHHQFDVRVEAAHREIRRAHHQIVVIRRVGFRVQSLRDVQRGAALRFSEELAKHEQFIWLRSARDPVRWTQTGPELEPWTRVRHDIEDSADALSRVVRRANQELSLRRAREPLDVFPRRDENVRHDDPPATLVQSNAPCLSRWCGLRRAPLHATLDPYEFDDVAFDSKCRRLTGSDASHERGIRRVNTTGQRECSFDHLQRSLDAQRVTEARAKLVHPAEQSVCQCHRVLALENPATLLPSENLGALLLTRHVALRAVR